MPDIALTILFIALTGVAIAAILALLKLKKTLDVATKMLVDVKDQVDPMVANLNTITTDIQPTVRKLEPVVDHVQLTLDAVNLEMMRVDDILDDVGQITNSAASATKAVDKISNAPVKAVTNVADKVREVFGPKHASEESAQIADQRAQAEEAMKDYKAAEAVEEEANSEPNYVEIDNAKPSAPAEPAAEKATEEAVDGE